MKRLCLLVLILITGIFCTTDNSSFAAQKGCITVQQSDYIELEPNMAEMSIGIETSDEDLSKATTSNNAKAQEVYKALAAILDDGDYLKTNNFTITPKYTTVEGKRVFDKYIVNNTITLKTMNLANISKILDTSVEKGANKIDNLQLSVSNYEQAGNELLAKLTAKAYSQANIIAASANSKITGIKNINASYDNNDRPRAYAMSLAKGADSINSTSTPFSKGKIKIYGNVSASFYTN